jgi:propionyl-CoA carboxylase alpha chain/3-methylcrotonyl-CoA carboxylase alpha subunit
MEMNTRLQVEHPVTEAITGVDLVEWQLRVAGGEPLPLAQAQIARKGHAIEARLYAEDPAAGFLPSIGTLTRFALPHTVRCDSSVEQGGVVSPWYDPMLAKLISHGESRSLAASELAQACAEVEVWPVRTNAWFLARCLAHDDFVAGAVDTDFIEARLDALAAKPTASPAVQAAAAAAFAHPPLAPVARGDPWASGLFGFQLNEAAQASLRLRQDGQICDMTLTSAAGLAEGAFAVEVVGSRIEVSRSGCGYVVDGASVAVLAPDPATAVVFDQGAAFTFVRWAAAAAHEADADGAIRAPMPGRIVSLSVAAGDMVQRNQPLVTLEAMKMEHVLTAPFEGSITKVSIAEGDQVSEGALLVEMEANSQA